MRQGSSPYGWSKYAPYLDCPKKAALQEAAGEHVPGSNKNLDLGTLVHGHLENFYSGVGGAMDTSEYPEEIVAEGDRIAKAYAVKFTPQELGTVVAVEKTLPCEPPEVITEENRSDELIERWEGFEADVLGVSDRLGLGRIPLTCRSDLVVRLTKDDCDRIYETRAVETTPGLWIVDHKTAARRDSLGAEKWAHDIQMSLNFLLWNACHDLWPGECSEPCVGVLVNTIYKTKEVGFETFVVRPTGDQCKAALGAVKLAARIRTDPTLREAPNPTRCFQYFEMCRFLQTAQCRRF